MNISWGKTSLNRFLGPEGSSTGHYNSKSLFEQTKMSAVDANVVSFFRALFSYRSKSMLLLRKYMCQPPASGTLSDENNEGSQKEHPGFQSHRSQTRSQPSAVSSLLDPPSSIPDPATRVQSLPSSRDSNQSHRFILHNVHLCLAASNFCEIVFHLSWIPLTFTCHLLSSPSPYNLFITKL